jgi:adrenodoxin-NADP+ reductase
VKSAQPYSGVAPDHAGTKSVTNRFDGILADPRVSFLGNVALGVDVHMDDLVPRYHATVLAYGAEGDKRLNIPGEDNLAGVCSAREFVGWFNGDPGCVKSLDGTMKDSLGRTDGDTAIIFGLGNVAVDCARVLLKRPEHLADTDICEHALQTLRTSTVRRVVMVGMYKLNPVYP